MARERILVKDAMDRVRKTLRELLKNFYKSNGDGESVTELSDLNLLSLSLRFLSKTRKVDNTLEEISEILRSMQISKETGIKTIEVITWDDEVIKITKRDLIGLWAQPFSLSNLNNNEIDLDLFYESFIYPTARALEALIMNMSYSNNINNLESITVGAKAFTKLINKIGIDNLCDEIHKCVPITQAITYFLLEEMNEYYVDFLNQILNYVLEVDPTLESIYAQDIYYHIRQLDDSKLNESELDTLYRDIESGIYRKLLKGIEFLSIFGYQLPLNINEKLLSLTSRYFRSLFIIKRENNGFEYYSSLAESVYNILLFSHNRSFAETVMNLLTEDSGWIYYRELDTLDLTKVIIGGGLLVLARAALRK